MKEKSKRLKVVLDLADRREKLALDNLVKKRTYRDEQKGQLESLNQYLNQFMQGAKESIESIRNVSQLASRQQFMDQIGQAIAQQEAVMGVAQTEFERALAIWTGFHQKTKGMSDLIGRYKVKEEQEREKRNEKQIEDDLTSRRFH